MASTETPAPEPEKVVEAAHEQENVVETSVVEPEKVAEAPPPEVEEATAPPPEVKTPGGAPPIDYFSLAEVVLRFLLFASAVVAVVVMVTSKQTKNSLPAKFNHLPAFIYFVAALSVAGLYSIITTLLSFYALLKPGCCPKVLSYFIIFDVLLLGIVAAATGSAGAVAYTGLKGNSHIGWRKVCDVYDEFCRHVGASVFVGLFASIVLVLLVLLSVYSISKKIPK